MPKDNKSWVQQVMNTSFATNPPPGIFTKNPQLIADAADVCGVAPKGLTSWGRMISFHRNRAGKRLSDERRKSLQEAILLLKERRQQRSSDTEYYEEGTLLPHKRIDPHQFAKLLGKQAAEITPEGPKGIKGPAGVPQYDDMRQYNMFRVPQPTNDIMSEQGLFRSGAISHGADNKGPAMMLGGNGLPIEDPGNNSAGAVRTVSPRMNKRLQQAALKPRLGV